LLKAMQSTETLLGWAGTSALPGQLDPFNPQHCELFFRELYGKMPLDERHVGREQKALNFANVAAAFRMIDDDWSGSLVVPWGEGLKRADAFRREPSRETGRALQPFTVQVSRRYLEHLVSLGAAEAWGTTRLHLPTMLFGHRYDDEYGLAIDWDSAIDPELLVESD
jgi:CRISPR-associated endonuclease/helicase Cas3